MEASFMDGALRDVWQALPLLSPEVLQDLEVKLSGGQRTKLSECSRSTLGSDETGPPLSLADPSWRNCGWTAGVSQSQLNFHCSDGEIYSQQVPDGNHCDYLSSPNPAQVSELEFFDALWPFQQNFQLSNNDPQSQPSESLLHSCSQFSILEEPTLPPSTQTTQRLAQTPAPLSGQHSSSPEPPSQPKNLPNLNKRRDAGKFSDSTVAPCPLNKQRAILNIHRSGRAQQTAKKATQSIHSSQHGSSSCNTYNASSGDECIRDNVEAVQPLAVKNALHTTASELLQQVKQLAELALVETIQDMFKNSEKREESRQLALPTEAKTTPEKGEKIRENDCCHASSKRCQKEDFSSMQSAEMCQTTATESGLYCSSGAVPPRVVPHAAPRHYSSDFVGLTLDARSSLQASNVKHGSGSESRIKAKNFRQSTPLNFVDRLSHLGFQGPFNGEELPLSQPSSSPAVQNPCSALYPCGNHKDSQPERGFNPPKTSLSGKKAKWQGLHQQNSQWQGLHQQNPPRPGFPRQMSVDKQAPFLRSSGIQTSSWQVAERRAKPQFMRTKLCPTLAKFGCCSRRDSCGFAHAQEELRPLPDLHKTKLCEITRKGNICTLPNCRFAHSLSELRTAEDLVTFKSSLCFFWRKGICFNGSKCRFAHGEEELQQQSQGG